MNRTKLFHLLPLLLLGVACQSAETESAGTTSTAADVEALTELVGQYDAAVNSGNLDGLMALFADDAVEMPPDEPVVIGKDAIRLRGEPNFAEYNDHVSSTVEDIQVSGDWAFQRMAYTESRTPKEGGDTTTVVGKWVLISQRQADGSWLIDTEIWNSDAPGNGD